MKLGIILKPKNNINMNPSLFFILIAVAATIAYIGVRITQGVIIKSKNLQTYSNQYFTVTFYVNDEYVMMVTDLIFHNVKCNLIKSNVVKYVKLPIIDRHIKICGQTFNPSSFRLDDDYGGFYYKLYTACEEEYKKQIEANQALSPKDNLLEDMNLNLKRRLQDQRRTVWLKKPYDDKDLV
jgi:hypothetical protein